jgi:ferredoxin
VEDLEGASEKDDMRHHTALHRRERWGCVDVRPVDCIHPAAGEAGYDEHEQLYINPDECIDCGACEPACPVTAIFEESAVPAQWREFLKINADYFKE